MTQNLVKKLKGGIANGYFDTVAAIAIVLKLLYGFNDVNWDQYSIEDKKAILEKANRQE